MGKKVYLTLGSPSEDDAGMPLPHCRALAPLWFTKDRSGEMFSFVPKWLEKEGKLIFPSPKELSIRSMEK